MSLSDRALTTLTALKGELGITGGSEDAKLERFIEVASSQILNALNRPQLHFEADRVEYVRGHGSRFLRVDLAPITAIASIAYTADGGTTESSVDSTGYIIEPATGVQVSGVIRRVGSVWRATGVHTRSGDYIPGHETKNYKVTYTGGYVTPKQVDDDGSLTRTLPYEIEEACLMLCSRRYIGGNTGETIKSERLMQASVTYANNAPTSSQGGVPDDIMGMIRMYRRAAL